LGELVKKALTFLLVCSSLVFVSALAQDLPPAATPQGEVQLGNVYSEQHDYAKAMTWYREAADQGNSDGQNNVGWLYQNGFGVKQDFREALTWYRGLSLRLRYSRYVVAPPDHILGLHLATH
jgi:Sel1 repeat